MLQVSSVLVHLSEPNLLSRSGVVYNIEWELQQPSNNFLLPKVSTCAQTCWPGKPSLESRQIQKCGLCKSICYHPVLSKNNPIWCDGVKQIDVDSTIILYHAQLLQSHWGQDLLAKLVLKFQAYTDIRRYTRYSCLLQQKFARWHKAICPS